MMTVGVDGISQICGLSPSRLAWRESWRPTILALTLHSSNEPGKLTSLMYPNYYYYMPRHQSGGIKQSCVMSVRLSTRLPVYLFHVMLRNGQCGRMATRDGQNVLDAEKHVVGISKTKRDKRD